MTDPVDGSACMDVPGCGEQSKWLLTALRVMASVIALVDPPVHAVPVGRAIHMAHPADVARAIAVYR